MAECELLAACNEAGIVYEQARDAFDRYKREKTLEWLKWARGGKVGPEPPDPSAFTDDSEECATLRKAKIEARKTLERRLHIALESLKYD